jgi:hypothetical protein
MMSRNKAQTTQNRFATETKAARSFFDHALFALFCG